MILGVGYSNYLYKESIGIFHNPFEYGNLIVCQNLRIQLWFMLEFFSCIVIIW
jgi:hypothetical protein